MINPKKAHKGKYNIAEESYENKGKVLPANETDLEIAITVFTSDYPMSKRYCLDEKGNIIKKQAIPLSHGGAVTQVVDSLSEFAELRNNLTDKNATAYGTFKKSEVGKPVKVASSNNLDKYVDAIARTNDNMHYDRRYYSLLFIDIDKDDVSGLSIEEKRKKFYEVFPQFARASRVESPSSSSYIRNRLDANTPDSGLKGIHIYYVVKPEELPIICDIIKTRLINEGYSWTIKSSSEAVLIRTIIDLSVFNQPSRLDYPSRAIVEAPLVQDENKAIYKKGEYEVVSLDMFEPLTEDEKNNYDKRISELKGKPDNSLVAQEVKSERITRVVQNFTDEELKEKYTEALNNNILPSDLELTTQSGETHTVGYFLEHSDEYDKCRVADPFDPYYSDDRCCQLNLTGSKPNLYNHHTQETYFLENNNSLMFGKVALPPGYYVTSDNQIWLETDIGSGENVKTKQTFISYNLVAVTAIIENISGGSQKVEVTFTDNKGLINKRVVPRETIAGKDMISLASFGILVDTNNQKSLSKYFTAQICANPDMPHYIGVKQLGFFEVDSKDYFIHGDGCICSDGFIPYGDARLPVNLVFDDKETEDLAKAIKSHGSEEKYNEMLKSLNKYPYIKIVLGAAIISLYLKKLGIKNFVLNLAMFTSTGKSTAQNIAASLFGKPDDFIKSFRFTQNGLERYCGITNNYPVIFDDTKTINEKRPEDVSKALSDLIYNHSEGKGKIRSNVKLEIREVMRWSNVMITSSEYRMMEKVNDGGIVGRIIEMTSYPFNEESDEMKRIVKQIEKFVEENYGFAVITVMKSIMANDWKKLAQYRKIYKDYEESFDKKLTSSIGGRLSNSAAAIMTGIEIMNQELCLEWETSDSMTLILKTCKAQSSKLTEGKRALEFVVEFAKTHKGESYKFKDTKDNLYDEQYVPGHNIDRKPCSWTIMHKGALCGFIEQNRIGFTTNNLKSILAENRFSFSPVISEWLKNGWLEKETTTGNNPQFKCKESKYRCITINQLGISVAEEKSSKVE